MPTEIRHILFDEDEVKDAIATRRNRDGKTGSTAAFEIYAEPTRAHVTLDSGAVEEMDEQTLCLAMIEYAIGRGIPLPKRAGKRMQAFRKSVVLIMNMGEAPKAG